MCSQVYLCVTSYRFWKVWASYPQDFPCLPPWRMDLVVMSVLSQQHIWHYSFGSLPTNWSYKRPTATPCVAHRKHSHFVGSIVAFQSHVLNWKSFWNNHQSKQKQSAKAIETEWWKYHGWIHLMPRSCRGCCEISWGLSVEGDKRRMSFHAGPPNGFGSCGGPMYCVGTGSFAPRPGTANDDPGVSLKERFDVFRCFEYRFSTLGPQHASCDLEISQLNSRYFTCTHIYTKYGFLPCRLWVLDRVTV